MVTRLLLFNSFADHNHFSLPPSDNVLNLLLQIDCPPRGVIDANFQLVQTSLFIKTNGKLSPYLQGIHFVLKAVLLGAESEESGLSCA